MRYEVLPHVIDVEAAMAEDAPLLHAGSCFTKGVEPKPATTASNIAEKIVLRAVATSGQGASDEAEVVIERRYKTAPVHQGYIEPHACVAAAGADGQHQIWASTQGHFAGPRCFCAKLLGDRASPTSG